MLNKLKIIRKKFRELAIDALFISNQQNTSYLTGFTGLAANEREGFLLITKNHAYFFVFPTYFGLFEKGSDGFTTVCLTHDKKLTYHVDKIAQKEKISAIGFEEENLTLAELGSLRKKVRVKWQPTKNIVECLRLIKEETELKHIKDAARITDLAFDFIKGKIKRGVTEKELALELEFFLKKNADDIAFSPIVAFDKNSAIPHYLSTHNSQLTTHNLILFDFGAKINGYCSDMTRVVFFGTPSNKQVKIYQIVLSAQKKALENLKPRKKTREIDKIARNYIVAAGFPEYPHGLGHGVGLSIHEDPKLKKDNEVILKKNMVVTVEPGIYLPGYCGVRIEDLVVVKKNGVEILSQSSKEITVI